MRRTWQHMIPPRSGTGRGACDGRHVVEAIDCVGTTLCRVEEQDPMNELMRSIAFVTMVGLAAMTACDEEDDGDTSGDSAGDTSASQTSGDESAGGDPCVELAQKCEFCTLPNLQTTCEAAVMTGDPDSCRDGLTDPDIVSDCVP